MIIESSCKVSPLPWDDYGPVIPHLLFFGAACAAGSASDATTRRATVRTPRVRARGEAVIA